MGRRAKVWVVAFVLVVLGGLFSILALLTGRANSARRIVMARWVETIGTPEDVLRSHPTHEMNSEALDLIDLTVPFGVDSAPRHEKELPRPDGAMAKRFRQFKAHGSRWFKTQLSKTGRPPDRPPAFVAAYLAEFRPDIDRVQEVLLDDTKPAWMLDLSRLFNSPLPNLLGHVDLNKLMLADSLAALSVGDTERAERALETAWELGQSLASDPTLTTQMVLLEMKRAQAAVVRQMPWLDRWISRLNGAEVRESIEWALSYEGWTWPQYDFSPSGDSGVFSHIKHAITGPFMRLGTADASERWRRTMLKLQNTPSWCRPELDRLGVSFHIPLPWWNQVGTILAFDIERAVSRVARAQLQFELTRRVLEMAATREQTGAWPVASEPWLRSRACPTDRWVYSTDGSVASLRLDREIAPSPGETLAAWQFSLDASVSAPVRKN